MKKELAGDAESLGRGRVPRDAGSCRSDVTTSNYKSGSALLILTPIRLTTEPQSFLPPALSLSLPLELRKAPPASAPVIISPPPSLSRLPFRDAVVDRADTFAGSKGVDPLTVPRYLQPRVLPTPSFARPLNGRYGCRLAFKPMASPRQRSIRGTTSARI
jgi:hypothetical protein